jgi:hypothetical protein
MSAMTDETERSNESRITVLETRFDDIVPTLATKSDLRELAARFDAIVPTLATKSDVRELAARFDAIMPTLATKADLERLRADMERQMASVIKWMIAAMITMVFGSGSMLLTVITLMKQS